MNRLTRHYHNTVVFSLLAVLLAGCDSAPPESTEQVLSWPQIEQRAHGQTVHMVMWRGNAAINRYMENFVAPDLKQRHDIDLKIAGGQGSDLVALLMAELETGVSPGQFDLVWINGETFYQLRKIKALYGPFTDSLPNAAYVDFANPFIGIDFQQTLDGYEMPWGSVQMILIYDTARIAQPPRTPAQLADWIKNHPGRFTLDTGFTGMTMLKNLLYAFSDNPDELHGAFDENVYQRLSGRLWQYLHELKPYLWRQGQNFPVGTAELHQLFINGEIDFTLSMNDSEVDNKILQGVFPKTARAYALDTGTIRNSHYLGIPRNSAHPEAAKVVIDFLVSPAAQLEKMQPAVWGDGTVLASERLPPPWLNRFLASSERLHAPSRQALEKMALMEPAPDYMLRLFEDFRREMLD